MTDVVTAETSIPTPPPGAQPAHIVDQLIDERMSAFTRALFNAPAAGALVKRLLRYSTAKSMADALAGMTGAAAFDDLARTLAMRLSVSGEGFVPPAGPALIVANHPTGLADGIALWEALRRVRGDVSVFANADALRIGPRYDDIIIPVEWRAAHRTLTKTRETLRASREALEAGRCVLVFPSGIPAIPTPLALKEQPWQATFLALAHKHDAPVVPAALRVRTSAVFYAFCLVNKSLRHMSLFREFINKAGAPAQIRFLEPIRYGARLGDADSEAERLRVLVSGDQA